ncbi:hypothetical protein ACFXG4_04785 [Nocardia sp. NPDC059246]|uniref:hypothetical protein n=1 Tax=unclassified Nocardia TaxID=2637762 RepID=UPI0036C5A871
MRIRSIKPEFWRSDDIDVLDWHHRLVFIGLWSYVDDNGVGLDKLASICADLFASDMERDPNETLARVSTALNSFVERGLIQRYSVDGKAFLFITGWPKHQRVVNPNKPRYPVPTSENAVIREAVAAPSRESNETLAPGTGEQGNRGTLTSNEVRGGTRKRATRLPEGWMPDEDTKAWARQEHPNVNLHQAHEKFVNYWLSKSGKDATKVDWNRTWRNWIIREAEHAPRKGQAASGDRDQKIADLERFKTNPNPAILNAFGGPPKTGVPSSPVRPARALPGGNQAVSSSPAAYQPPLLGEVS